MLLPGGLIYSHFVSGLYTFPLAPGLLLYSKIKFKMTMFSHPVNILSGQ